MIPRAIEFVRPTYPKFCETVSGFSDLLDGRPLEDPLWAEQPDQKPGANDFDGPLEAQLMSGRYLVVFPVYSMTKAGGGDCHKSHLAALFRI